MSKQAPPPSNHAPPPPSFVPEPPGAGSYGYETGKELGKGGFAICHEAEVFEGHKRTGQKVALKIVKSKMAPASIAQKFITELQIHSKLSHPNIVEFYRAFPHGKSTFVVLEQCENQSLAHMLKRRKFLTMPEIRRMIIQVCGAVKYLHHRNIVHRDLKTGNLLLDGNMNIKVGDFGLAALLVNEYEMGKRRTTMCGTPNYLAPEVLEKGKGHNEKVDLWAIGIIAYTLAVGSAPFASKTKEEIYQKVAARDYKWPELTESKNDISPDLRDLVATLLVHETERPAPDKIVSHDFFKKNFVPLSLPNSCASKAIKWPQNRPPSPTTLQRGYSDTWYQVCKESGVGELVEGKAFPSETGKRMRSIVRDIEREMRAGRQPVVPMPSHMVYLPYPERPSAIFAGQGQVSEVSEDRESSTGLRQLSEISPNGKSFRTAQQDPGDVNLKRSTKCDERPREEEHVDALQTTKEQTDAEKAESDRKRMAPPPLPIRASARAVPIRQAEVEHQGSIRRNLSKKDTERLGRQGSDGSVRTGAKRGVANFVAEVELRERADHGIDRQMAKAANKETAIPSMDSKRSVSAESEVKTTIQDTLKRTRSARGVRRVAKEELAAPPAGAFSQSLARRPKTMRHPTAEQAANISAKRIDSLMMAEEEKHIAGPRSDSPECVPTTDPATVLARVAIFRDNIAQALASKNSPPGTRTGASDRKLPFVTKWVDYSRKHGIGYVLADGTIGCIVNNPKWSSATHVVVGRGQPHLKKIQKDTSAVDIVPFRFYTETVSDGLTPVQLGNERRSTGILWAKFGQYMCQSLGQEEEKALNDVADTASDDMPNFVRFYQRFGNVGIWAFTDGCFQLNFPDHTKLVLSADGKACSFTCLPLEAFEHLMEFHDLPYKFITRRRLLSGSLEDLLSRYSQERVLIAANGLSSKLAFAVSVAEQWIAGGGLGFAPKDSKLLRWEGVKVEDNTKKSEWVTVGRLGGDVVHHRGGEMIL